MAACCPDRPKPHRGVPQRLPHLAAVGVLVAVLAGCDTLDPRESLIPHVDKPVPATSEPYPNLATVPEQAPPVTPAEQRSKLLQKLEADAKGQGYQPDTSNLPSLPNPPPPVPATVMTAQPPPSSAAPARSAVAAKPVEGAKSGEKTAPAQAAKPAPTAPKPAPPEAQVQAAAGLPADAPAFGALGRPQQVAVVLFEARGAKVDPGQIGRLKPIVARLHRRGGLLQVVGHAAGAGRGRGPAEGKLVDFNLSLDRANAVARALMSLGVKPSELVVTAEGDSAPSVAIEGVDGADPDQRADIYLEY